LQCSLSEDERDIRFWNAVCANLAADFHLLQLVPAQLTTPTRRVAASTMTESFYLGIIIYKTNLDILCIIPERHLA
jgi:hypothetical protein